MKGMTEPFRERSYARIAADDSLRHLENDDARKHLLESRQSPLAPAAHFGTGKHLSLRKRAKQHLAAGNCGVVTLRIPAVEEQHRKDVRVEKNRVIRLDATGCRHDLAPMSRRNSSSSSSLAATCGKSAAPRSAPRTLPCFAASCSIVSASGKRRMAGRSTAASTTVCPGSTPNRAASTADTWISPCSSTVVRNVFEGTLTQGMVRRRDSKAIDQGRRTPWDA